MEPPAPTFLVGLLHSVPHVNITLHRVNDTFNPNSEVYIESLGILASIPAALLILSLVGFLLYLLTRCCDRKPRRKTKSNLCQKWSLILITAFCCGAIGLGLYGNDDLHNGMLQVFGSGRKVELLIVNVRNQANSLKRNLTKNIVISELEDIFERPTFNQTALSILLDTVRLVKDNTTLAKNALETVLYLIRPINTEITINKILDTAESYEMKRWPVTLAFLTILLLLCVILIIGVARSSRCSLIFFSVSGLLAVTLCWLLSGIYLSTCVALGDFCMKPNEYICNQQKLQEVYYTNCGSYGTNRFILRLNESRDYVDRAKEALLSVNRISMELYPRSEIQPKIKRFQEELDNGKRQLAILTSMLDQSNLHEHYKMATKGLCETGLQGLALMMVASLVAALLLTILVCVDSHAWIYLTKKRPYGDKSETTPLFPSGSSVSPTAPLTSGTSTINRTLLHHQQQNQQAGVLGAGTGITIDRSSNRNNGITLGGLSGTAGGGGAGVLGGPTTGIGMRGLAYSGDSPPPDYNVVVHGSSRNSGHHTLGRLPSQQHTGYLGPNNGKYATLSKQCKTLESNDCY